MDDMKVNAEKYSDPTAYGAYKNIQKGQEALVSGLAYTIYRVAHLAGFHVESIVLVDNKTGKRFKKRGRKNDII
jgi:hypothetical protein